MRRVTHSDHHIEIFRESYGKAIASTHFLRFMQPVDGLEKQCAAVAFELQAEENSSAFDSNKSLSEQFRIVPAVPGRVAVFFTAAKETSGLRFHLHAPFVPELSRASVKDTPANGPLFRQLAGLSAQSLFAIRDLGLLNTGFLAALPNPNDDLPVRYECIREAIIDVMNKHPLTPTYSGSHAPAKQLLQAPAALKALLDEEDVEVLVDYEKDPPTWAIAAAQRNSNIARFLSGLDIEEWGVEQFVQILEEGLYADLTEAFDPDNVIITWLYSKSDEWHQRLYALLYRELEPEHELDRLDESCIVRLSTGNYKKGNECYFPTIEVREDPVLPRVAEGTYTSGRSKAEQDRARKFLESVGVREVGEQEQVESILKQRYSGQSDIPNRKTYRNDLRRFIALTESDPGAVRLFRDYRIFELENGNWGKPGQVYLDVPYMDTGLHSYFRLFGNKSKCVALARSYTKLGISSKELAKFARSVGASHRLEIASASCYQNPQWDHLRRAPGAYFTYSGVNRDFTIHGLLELFQNPTARVSRLVWNTLCNRTYNGQYLQACYRKNRSNSPHYANSQLVHQLRISAWIPQRNGEFVRPAAASQELLPEGFPFDAGSRWLAAVGFGEEGAKRVEERRKTHKMAKELGFGSVEAMDDARRFAELPPDTRRRILAENEVPADLPNREPNDRKRRAERVREQARDAPERTTETRTRSVSVNRDAVKREKTDPYLLELYTNSDGVTICQVCKQALPFKLADGSYYFETVEFLPGLKRHHHQNYLALCPNHAAMYKHVNGSMETMKGAFLSLDGNELEVVLAEETATIYFSSAHLLDLKAVIEAEETRES